MVSEGGAQKRNVGEHFLSRMATKTVPGPQQESCSQSPASPASFRKPLRPLQETLPSHKSVFEQLLESQMTQLSPGYLLMMSR